MFTSLISGWAPLSLDEVSVTTRERKSRSLTRSPFGDLCSVFGRCAGRRFYDEPTPRSVIAIIFVKAIS